MSDKVKLVLYIFLFIHTPNYALYTLPVGGSGRPPPLVTICHAVVR